MQLILNLAVCLLLIGCASMKYDPKKAQKLEIDELEVVQQTHDLNLRKANPLYLPMRKVQETEFNSAELKKFVEQLRNYMHQKEGIGIAANQIGKNIQIFLIEAKSDNPRYQVLGEVPFQIFINPRITKASKTIMNFWHGCLSAVGEKRGNVATYQWIEYETRTIDGKTKKGKLEGLAAVIFQHELRHLLGGTYLDKAKIFYDKAELDAKLDRKELPFFAKAGSELPLLLDDYQIGDSLEVYYEKQTKS